MTIPVGVSSIYSAMLWGTNIDSFFLLFLSLIFLDESAPGKKSNVTSPSLSSLTYRLLARFRRCVATPTPRAPLSDP